MPEGPEVKLFTDRLTREFLNKKVLKIEVLSGRYIRKPIENISLINNKTFKGINCKGKFIWFEFEDVIVFNTLGMTGSWSRRKTDYSRIGIYFNDGDKLYFNDISADSFINAAIGASLIISLCLKFICRLYFPVPISSPLSSVKIFPLLKDS